jgi:Tfp pilus assembly protein PilX
MKNQEGQTLITLLIFIIIALTITSAATSIIINNSIVATKFEQSTLAKSIAESGIENAMIKLLRNPSYTGETINIDNGTAIATVSGTTIVSTGRVGNYSRKIQVVTTLNNGVRTIVSWKEIP